MGPGPGVGVRWVTSILCEGRLDTGGSEGAEPDPGAAVTMAASVSKGLSPSGGLLGAWPAALGFAGRRRATCSTHSTLAFWHLEHVLCRDG